MGKDVGVEGTPATGGELRMRESLGDLPDSMLVSRAQRGDSRAFEAVMRRYNRKLFRIARGVLRDATMAEDAVQEAYLRAFTHLHQYQPSGRFSAWLSKVAVNEALMIRRKLRTDTFSLEQMEEAGLEPCHAGPFRLPGDEVAEDCADSVNARQLLERVVDRLPEYFRLVFILRRVEQMTAAEVATTLGINEGTVRTRLHRADRLLRADLSRLMQSEQLNLYEFGGTQCDRIVTAVLAKLVILKMIREPPP
jgi:RNA polymerase sigma-70 factor (ECF subfamily)